jgi:ferredoxin
MAEQLRSRQVGSDVSAIRTSTTLAVDDVDAPPREKGSPMKVKVEGSICQGHTLCAMAAPKVFQLDDEDGHASAISEDVAPELEASAHEAQRSCPEQAITIF